MQKLKSHTFFRLVKKGQNESIKDFDRKPSWNKLKSDNSLNINGNNAQNFELLEIEVKVLEDSRTNVKQLFS